MGNAVKGPSGEDMEGKGNMERLTERTADGKLVKEGYGENASKPLRRRHGAEPMPHYENCDEGHCAMERLAEYEDLEERGGLLAFPSGVSLGDTVYSPILDPLGEPRKYIAESEVEDISLKGITFAGTFVPWEEFGRMDFLAKEEAESALEKLG